MNETKMYPDEKSTFTFPLPTPLKGLKRVKYRQEGDNANVKHKSHNAYRLLHTIQHDTALLHTANPAHVKRNAAIEGQKIIISFNASEGAGNESHCHITR